MGYMYASAFNARAADVRVTATRLGQLFLDSWKTTGTVDPVAGWDVDGFDPTDNQFDSMLPAPVTTTASGVDPVGSELGRYITEIDGKRYFITLSYRDGPDESAGSGELYLLNACVAWNDDSDSTTLESDAKKLWLSSYSIY
jgi:hypothetical protein